MARRPTDPKLLARVREHIEAGIDVAGVAMLVDRSTATIYEYCRDHNIPRPPRPKGRPKKPTPYIPSAKPAIERFELDRRLTLESRVATSEVREQRRPLDKFHTRKEPIGLVFNAAEDNELRQLMERQYPGARERYLELRAAKAVAFGDGFYGAHMAGSEDDYFDCFRPGVFNAAPYATQAQAQA